MYRFGMVCSFTAVLQEQTWLSLNDMTNDQYSTIINIVKMFSFFTLSNAFTFEF